MKLRGSVTYNNLLERLFKRTEIDERVERLILAAAKMTLDYLLLAYLQCKLSNAPWPKFLTLSFLPIIVSPSRNSLKQQAAKHRSTTTFRPTGNGSKVPEM